MCIIVLKLIFWRDFKLRNTVIHIIPIGKSPPARIIAGLKQYPGNKIYFILGKKETETELIAREHLEEIKEKISELYEIEVQLVDVFDFNDILKNVSEIIRKEREKEQEDKPIILVNISSGTGIVIIALAIAAFLNDAQLYYARPKDYETPSEVDDVIVIPPLPIRLPGDEELKILKILSDSPARSLLEIAKKADFGEDKKSIAKVSYYIRKLEDDDLIEVERSKRRMNMQIGEKGTILISALKS